MEGALFLIAFLLPLEFFATKTGRTLKVLQSLQNGTYENGTLVKMSCKIQNATSYHWLKDGEYLSLNKTAFRIKSRELVIKSIGEQASGVYECVGTDEKGNAGRTRARIKLLDPGCIRKKDIFSECVYFDEILCENVRSFPPKVENVRVEIQADYNVSSGDVPKIWFAIMWDVPRVGRASLWGWQVSVLSLPPNKYFECYQLNVRPRSIYSKQDMTKVYHVPIPYTSTTYSIEVKSVPYFKNENVVKTEVKSPSECDLIINPRDWKACCKSQIDGDMMVTANNSVALNWTLNFPSNLNITGYKFLIRWESENREVCDDGHIKQNSTKSNYTILSLSNRCNYTIVITLLFTQSSNIKCIFKKTKIFHYITPRHIAFTSTAPVIKKPTPKWETAAFVIAAILAGVVVAALIYIWKKRKDSKREDDALGMEIGRIFDYRITSSSFKKDFPPHGARLNTNSAWSSDVDNERIWIQIDLCKKKVLSGIATQGCKAADEWVTEYSVSYSNDGELYETYQINDIEEVFVGNRDRNSIVKNVFSPPITARYIRVQPKSWHNKITMRLELYGHSNIHSTGEVCVFILNPNHCDLCTDVVHTLAVLLTETGRIHCEVDIFAPMNERSQGILKFTKEKISICDYVIIPWMCRIHVSDDSTFEDVNTLNFLSGLDIIHGELFRNRNKKNKFIPVCLDHCSLDILPPEQIHLPKYNIPSKIDDLVIELLGETRRQPDKEGLLEIEGKEYADAKTKLILAIARNKKSHSKQTFNLAETNNGG